MLWTDDQRLIAADSLSEVGRILTEVVVAWDELPIEVLADRHGRATADAVEQLCRTIASSGGFQLPPISSKDVSSLWRRIKDDDPVTLRWGSRGTFTRTASAWELTAGKGLVATKVDGEWVRS